MWLQQLSMEQTYDLWALDVGGREGTLRAPRGQPKGRNSHAHAQLFSILSQLSPSFLLGGWGWGLTVKGQEKWEQEERNPISPLNKNKTNEREQRVIFAPQKMEIQGLLDGQWMETSKRLRRRQPTVIGSLRPPIGWEKPSRPLPSQGRRLSPSWLLRLGLSESAPQSAKPRPGAAFARPVHPSHRPAPPRA